MKNKGLGSKPPERSMILDNALIGAIIILVVFFLVCGFWKAIELIMRLFN